MKAMYVFFILFSICMTLGFWASKRTHVVFSKGDIIATEPFEYYVDWAGNVKPKNYKLIYHIDEVRDDVYVVAQKDNVGNWQHWQDLQGKVPKVLSKKDAHRYFTRISDDINEDKSQVFYYEFPEAK